MKKLVCSLTLLVLLASSSLHAVKTDPEKPSLNLVEEIEGGILNAVYGRRLAGACYRATVDHEVYCLPIIVEPHVVQVFRQVGSTLVWQFKREEVVRRMADALASAIELRYEGQLEVLAEDVPRVFRDAVAGRGWHRLQGSDVLRDLRHRLCDGQPRSETRALA